MPLTQFEVSPDLDVDLSVIVKADDAKERVVGYVKREALDDYFPKRKLTDRNRFDLVDSNRDAILSILSRKYERGEWSPEGRYGSTIRRIDIAYSDLRAAPPLLDSRLVVQDGAGFQRPAGL